MAFTGEIGHLEGIESPWGNAGGVVKTVDDVWEMAHTGVGWIEAGSYTLEPRVGNSPNGETVYHHNPQTGETFNSLGMPNQGMDVIEDEIPEMVRIAHSYDKPLVVNVAPVTDDPVQESYELVCRAQAAGADAVLLNAGCPNVVTHDGSRHQLLSRSATGLWKVLTKLSASSLEPIFIRISPMEDQTQQQVTLDSVKNSGAVSAVFTPNTWPGQVAVNSLGVPILEVPGGAGGKSGPAMANEAQKELAFAVRHLGGRNIDVISSSSIMDARELQVRLSLGAVAGAGTTFFYESENWRKDTNRLLAGLRD